MARSRIKTSCSIDVLLLFKVHLSRSSKWPLKTKIKCKDMLTVQDVPSMPPSSPTASSYSVNPGVSILKLGVLFFCKNRKNHLIYYGKTFHGEIKKVKVTCE